MPKGRGAISLVSRENNFEPRVIYPAKLRFIYEGNWRTFPDTQELRGFFFLFVKCCYYSPQKRVVRQLYGKKKKKQKKKVG